MNTLCRQFEIILFRARALMAAEVAKTYLNFLWWVLDPLVTMVVFYVVFAVVLERGTEDYPVFLIVGLVVWQWFANTVASSSGAIYQAASLIGQVRFSKVVLPLTVIAVNTFKFLFVFLVLVLILWVTGYGPSASYFALPFLILLQLLLIYGVATLLAALMPVLPDLQYVIGNVLRAMMFLSAIFYPVTAIPEEYRSLFNFNPMVPIIDGYRSVLMLAEWPNMPSLVYAGSGAVLLAVGATVIVKALDPHFSRLVAQK